MNATLREQLIHAEQQFLLAVASNDEESLKIFSQEWSQLVKNVKAAGRLDDNTALFFSEVSRAIESMTLCMLESVTMLQEARTCSIRDFIQDLPSGDPPTSLHPQAITPCHLLFSNPFSLTPRILGHKTFLDAYAYRWFMQNIHDPYPNSVQTRVISDVSGTSVAQVELWFQEVRDSIGWSELSRDFFAGSVNATVAAARRVYLEHDNDISFDVVFAFTAVKTFAETLFSEHRPLQGKNVDIGSAQTIRAMAMDQGDHIGPFPDKATVDPESVLVPLQVDLPAPLGLFSDLSDSDESEEEDTTPPPPIAGCKRLLADDVLTSQVYDLGRPQKRHRTSINRKPSEPECSSLLPSTSGLSSEQPTPYTSAEFVSPSPSLRLLSPTSPGSLPVSPSSVSEGRGYVEPDKDIPEGAVRAPHSHNSAHGIRKRRLSQRVSSVPSKRQCSSISPRRHSMNPVQLSDGCPDLSLPQDRPTCPDAVLQPAFQVSVNPDTPVNLSVFDWDSISDPLTDTMSMPQPAVAYVPSSDLTSQLPGFGHDATTGSSSFVDLGPLEDLSSSLQFPIPADRSPGLSNSFTVSSGSPLQDFDWSSITELIDSFSPGSTQSSSLSGSPNTLPTTPRSSQESLSSSQSCNSSKQPWSVLDPSVPPSVLLPPRSGAFTEDVHNMLSFL